MSDSDPATPGDDPAIPIDQREAPRSAKPFLIAVVIAVIAIVAVVVLALTRPAASNVTAADRIAVAAQSFAAARSDSDPERRASTECAAFDEQKSPLGPEALGKKVEIAGVDAVEVHGERATASVTSNIDGHGTVANWTLTQENGRWTVCNTP